MVRWLRLHPSYAEDAGSIPGWGARIPCAVRHGQKIKEWQGSLSRVKLSIKNSHAHQNETATWKLWKSPPPVSFPNHMPLRCAYITTTSTEDLFSLPTLMHVPLLLFLPGLAGHQQPCHPDGRQPRWPDRRPRCPLFLGGSLPRPADSSSSAPSCCHLGAQKSRLGGEERLGPRAAGALTPAVSVPLLNQEPGSLGHFLSARGCEPLPRDPSPEAPRDSVIGQGAHPSPSACESRSPVALPAGNRRQFSRAGCSCTSHDSMGSWSLRSTPTAQGSGPLWGHRPGLGPVPPRAGRPSVLHTSRGRPPSGWVTALSSTTASCGPPLGRVQGNPSLSSHLQPAA